MLFTTKTFIVVPLHLEELLEVNFAVDDALQCRICANTEGRMGSGRDERRKCEMGDGERYFNYPST